MIMQIPPQLIEQLDLIISVDTPVARTKPMWVLLPFALDYRRLLDRDASLRYPTVKQYR